MSDPVAAREALIIEAIGDAANLFDAMERAIPEFQEMAREISRANAELLNSLAAFESQVLGLTEKAKVQAVKHILARTDEAMRRSIDLQARAMADAARVALGAEFGAALQRLQSSIQPLVGRPGRRWEPWLTHAGAAVTASAVTWMLVVSLWAR